MTRFWLSRLSPSARPAGAHRPDFWATVEFAETDRFAADTVRVVATDPPRAEQLATLSTQVAPSAPTVDVVPPTETLYVPGHKVLLRAEADGKARILDRFGPGDAVMILARSGESVQVRNVRT